MPTTRILRPRAPDEPTLSEMFSDADYHLLNRVVNNSEHVLQPFLTERPQTYNLRRRPHGSKTLFEKNNITMIRTSLLGLCTNTAINSHFTTLLLLTMACIGLYFFKLYLTFTYLISISMCTCCTLRRPMSTTLLNEYGMVWYKTAWSSSSGRPLIIVRTDDNIVSFNDLVASPEDAPKMHRSTRQIARQTAIQYSSLFDVRCTALFK